MSAAPASALLTEARYFSMAFGPLDLLPSFINSLSIILDGGSTMSCSSAQAFLFASFRANLALESSCYFLILFANAIYYFLS
jgi:hypothetical protein